MNQTNTKQNPTLEHVAKKCGLSISTVSKILSGSARFKQETKDLVMETAREMGYTPNAMARSIVTKERNKMVGFFVPNIMNPFFAELVNSVERKISEKGYMLMLCLYNDDPQKLSKYLNLLIETRAAGIMAASCREDDCQEDFELARKYMSVVSIQADIDNVDRVDVTDEEGTREIIEYLIQKGHRKIGFVGYRYDISILNRRLNGYKNALQEYNIPIDEKYICGGKHNLTSAYDMVDSLLNLPEPPTAIHCMNEFMAQGAFDAIRDHGLSIPEDISMTAFDDIFISKLIEPPLTTISDPIDILSDIAVDMLIFRIENPGNNRPPQNITVKHRFVERKSVKDINAIK